MPHTHITSVWSEEHSSLGQRWRKSGLFGVKKSFFRLRRAPSSGISLSGGQVSGGRLRRGLIVIAEHPHDMIHTYITSIWSGAGSVLSQRWWKIMYFGTLVVWYPQKIVCILSLRGRTQSLSSLLNTVACPCRYPTTCLVLTSRLSGLKRTHHYTQNLPYLHVFFEKTWI